MILLWDSSAPTARYAIVRDGQSAEFSWEANRTLARDMLAHLRDRLAATGDDLHSLAGIGVFRGPGSFTGLRIGLTVLNTLAEARDIPIVGAEGDSWQADALRRLEAGENDRIVLPFYGADAHITHPRK